MQGESWEKDRMGFPPVQAIVPFSDRPYRQAGSHIQRLGDRSCP